MGNTNAGIRVPSIAEAERLNRALMRAQVPIVRELKRVGYDITSLWEHDRTKPNDRAIDILVEHLQREHPFQIRWAITNLISGKYARKYFPLFVQLFVDDPDVTGYKAKSGIGGLIGEYCDASTESIAVALTKDKRHGESRVALLAALFHRRIPAALNAIDELATDPSVRSITEKHRKRIVAKKPKKVHRKRRPR